MQSMEDSGVFDPPLNGRASSRNDNSRPLAAILHVATVAVMNNSMQTLGVVGRLFPLILSGEKTSTIRFREVRIVPGPMRYVCDEDACKSAVVNVLKCTDMPLASVAAYLGKSTEWPDEVMLRGMRDHYPEIEPADIVQVVEHEPFKPTDTAVHR
jgi:hypothetical protein